MRLLTWKEQFFRETGGHLNANFCNEYYNCPTAVNDPMSVLFLWQSCAFIEIDTSEKLSISNKFGDENESKV